MFDIFFVRELQKLLSIKITVNAVHPGFCVSELLRNVTGERTTFMQQAMQAIGYTSEEGARCLVYRLVPEQGNEERLRGKYLALMQTEIPTSPFSNSKEGLEAQVKIWVRHPLNSNKGDLTSKCVPE